MTTNLFDKYRLIAQRSRRDPHCSVKVEMTELAHQLVKEKMSKEEMLGIADNLRVLENEIPNVQTYYSTQIIDALQKGEYEIAVPHQISHRWKNAAADGVIYIFTAPSKDGLSKLGATTIPVKKRLQLYIHRYGYETYCFYEQHVKRVFEFEKRIQDRIVHRRVAVNTLGDSNEWYEIEPEKLRREVENELAATSR